MQFSKKKIRNYTLQEKLGRTEPIERVKFLDVNGVADRLNIYF